MSGPCARTSPAVPVLEAIRDVTERSSITGTSTSLPVIVQWPNSLTLSMIQFNPLMTTYASKPPMIPAAA